MVATVPTTRRRGRPANGASDDAPSESISAYLLEAVYDGGVDIAARRTMPSAMKAALIMQQRTDRAYTSIRVYKVRSRVVVWDSSDDSE